MIMKYIFLIIAIVSLISGFCGNHYLYWIAVIGMLMATAIHLDDRQAKKEKKDFFD